MSRVVKSEREKEKFYTCFVCLFLIKYKIRQFFTSYTPSLSSGSEFDGFSLSRCKDSSEHNLFTPDMSMIHIQKVKKHRKKYKKYSLKQSNQYNLPRPLRPTNLRSLNFATWFLKIACELRNSPQQFSSLPALTVTSVPSGISPNDITLNDIGSVLFERQWFGNGVHIMDGEPVRTSSPGCSCKRSARRRSPGNSIRSGDAERWPGILGLIFDFLKKSKHTEIEDIQSQ